MAQDKALLQSFSIPSELKQNANAVIRLNEVKVNLRASDEMIINVKRIITVLNKNGDRHVDAFVHYDDDLEINDLEVLIYDAFGKEINKIKTRDFNDVSAVDGGTLYGDSRVKYLEYTAITYPYTVELTYETETKNTAFIPWFYPLADYHLSVEKSTYSLSNPSQLAIRYKILNAEAHAFTEHHEDASYNFSVEHIEAIRPEDHSPLLADLVPKIMFATKTFNLKGVAGSVENWSDFGKWMYKDLLDGTHELPEKTILEVNALIENVTDPIEKAKKVYEYVQNKTRYISVQVGIGGWKPFSAAEVDRLSYGDCKALTNYTMALLNVVGVTSYYTVVFAGNSQKNIQDDFASLQGNHVILNIPNEDETIWLECTSQKLPFGFIGDFTDDRDVLVVTPSGGEIQHTKKYTAKENTQTTKSTCKIFQDGSIDVSLNSVSRGIQYDKKYLLASSTERELEKAYKARWSYINNMSIEAVEIGNDKQSVTFTEDLSFKATNYGNLSGERMLVVVNAVNRFDYVPDRYRNRMLPLKLKRGFKDVDEIELHLPKGYTIEALPKDENLSTKFGSYKRKIVKVNDSTLLYKREFTRNDGDFPKEDYKEFRNFYKEITNQDHAKMALIKTNQP
ncbi:DUF3857 domain-containing protein [Subsaximicrobium wynnwilliamsii]|nr:DUF3857 domain-containing transglutaminase family protein [Subsaximicrobium wynnwilliamsii]